MNSFLSCFFLITLFLNKTTDLLNSSNEMVPHHILHLPSNKKQNLNFLFAIFILSEVMNITCTSLRNFCIQCGFPLFILGIFFPFSVQSQKFDLLSHIFHTNEISFIIIQLLFLVFIYYYCF